MDYTSRLCSTAAAMKEANSGCGSKGRDFSSGWNCTPMNQGWSAYSIVSGRRPSGDMPAEAQAVLLQPVPVVDVHLVAVAVALGDLGRAVDSGDAGCRARAPPDRRRAAWCRRDRRRRARFSSSLPRIHSVIRPTTGSCVGPNSVELALRRCRRDCAPPRSPPSACRSRCRSRARLRSRANWAARILPSVPRSPKPPGTRMPWTSFEIAAPGPRCSKISLSIQSRLTLHLVGDAAVGQRLDQRFVGVLEAGVLADDGDRHLALGVADALGDRLPAGEVGRRRVLDAESRQHLARRALRRDRRAARRRWWRRRAPGSPRSRARCRTARACAAPPSGSAGRSGRAGCRAGCRSSAAP